MIKITKDEIKSLVRKALHEVMLRGEDNVVGTNSSNDIAIIGHFVSEVEIDSNLHYVGEAKVGVFKSFTVYVYSVDNGMIPHMHIVLTDELGLPTKKRTFDCCIKIENNEYFKHAHHQSIFTSRQCKDFNTFMHQLNALDKTNYEVAVFLWNTNCERSNVKVQKDNDGNIIIPNYSTII